MKCVFSKSEKNDRILMKNDENDITAKSVLRIVKIIYGFILMLALNLKLFTCRVVFVVLDINIFIYTHSLIISIWKANEC